MTKAQVAQLLTLIAAFDRRTIGETDVEAWHLILRDQDVADCSDAIRAHFATSSDWLMPAQVLRLATDIARRRAGRQRLAQLEQNLAAENPPAIETTDRARPLRALMAGSPVKSAPRPDWQQRRALPARPAKPPLTDAELAAACQLLEEAAAASRCEPAPACDAPRPLNPDCRDDKHAACAGDAWDDATDQRMTCACECHAPTPKETDERDHD